MRTIPMNHWFFLSLAIIAEVIATSALKHSEGFTKLWPTLITAVGYTIAFYLLSLTLRTLPMGIAYAVWSGVGIVLISLVGWLAFKQNLDTAAIIGMCFIVLGVAIINTYSNSMSHG